MAPGNSTKQLAPVVYKVSVVKTFSVQGTNTNFSKLRTETCTIKNCGGTDTDLAELNVEVLLHMICNISLIGIQNRINTISRWRTMKI